MTQDALSGGDNRDFGQLQFLLDHIAITDVLHRYCRALDRMDRPLAESCWHPGGTDSHAPLYSGEASGFLDWVWPLHAAAISFRHVLTNITIHIEGDRAGAESYWTATMRVKGSDGLVDLLSGGRYADTFERIDGAWAIRHRQVLRDWGRADPVSDLSPADILKAVVTPNNPEEPMMQSRRDRDDYSYTVLGLHEAPTGQKRDESQC